MTKILVVAGGAARRDALAEHIQKGTAAAGVEVSTAGPESAAAARKFADGLKDGLRMMLEAENERASASLRGRLFGFVASWQRSEPVPDRETICRALRLHHAVDADIVVADKQVTGGSWTIAPTWARSMMPALRMAGSVPIAVVVDDEAAAWDQVSLTGQGEGADLVVRSTDLANPLLWRRRGEGDDPELPRPAYWPALGREAKRRELQVTELRLRHHRSIWKTLGIEEAHLQDPLAVPEGLPEERPGQPTQARDIWTFACTEYGTEAERRAWCLGLGPVTEGQQPYCSDTLAHCVGACLDRWTRRAMATGQGPVMSMRELLSRAPWLAGGDTDAEVAARCNRILKKEGAAGLCEKAATSVPHALAEPGIWWRETVFSRKAARHAAGLAAPPHGARPNVRFRFDTGDFVVPAGEPDWRETWPVDGGFPVSYREGAVQRRESG